MKAWDAAALPASRVRIRLHVTPLVLFGLSLFVSAAMLFLLEPMFARIALPLLGGSPSVWITAVLFYQAVLLAAYAYAHALTRLFTPRQQVLIHVACMLVALATLPVGVPEGWRPPAAGQSWWLLILFARGVGLPFFVVASSGPLLQSWFAAGRDRRAADPYFLYAASNAGSLVGLLAYPFAVEPTMGLHAQSALWALGFGALLVLLVGCASTIWRLASVEATTPVVVASSERLTVRRRLRWVLLASVPSSLMLSVTSYVSVEVAPVPLLWALPLGIYLATLTLAFARQRLVPRTLLFGLAPPLVVLVLAAMLLQLLPALAAVGVHLFVFFVSALACHTLLAEDRPHPSNLTQFYLWLAVGGAVGGAFNALVAPLAFSSVMEYPIGLVALCLLMPCVRGVGRPRLFGLGASVLALVNPAVPTVAGSLQHAERSFFGVHRVAVDSDSGVRRLMHGTTLHGEQWLNAQRSLEPRSYYTQAGPLGQVFSARANKASTDKVAVVGLGTGTVACYVQNRALTFYELDPVVQRIAADPQYFTFLRDCPPAAVVLGDARLRLEEALPASYDLMVFDAYTSDAIPTHLLTREAMSMYLRKLRPGGVLAFHLSNRYFDLERVAAGVCADAGLVCRLRADYPPAGAYAETGRTRSIWAVMARDSASLGDLLDREDWRPLTSGPNVPVWTDDYSSLMSVLRPLAS